MAVVYWLLSLSGLADSDVLEGDVGEGGSLALGGLLATLDLHDVPLSLVITLLALTGWPFSYFATLLLGKHLNPGLLLWLLNSVVLVLGFVIATIVTSFLIRPLRPLFRPAQLQPIEPRLTGKQCTVRSAVVTKEKGRAGANIDGDHLVLQARSDSVLERGEL